MEEVENLVNYLIKRCKIDLVYISFIKIVDEDEVLFQGIYNHGEILTHTLFIFETDDRHELFFRIATCPDGQHSFTKGINLKNGSNSNQKLKKLFEELWKKIEVSS